MFGIMSVVLNGISVRISSIDFGVREQTHLVLLVLHHTTIFLVVAICSSCSWFQAAQHAKTWPSTPLYYTSRRRRLLSRQHLGFLFLFLNAHMLNLVHHNNKNQVKK